MRTNGTTKRKPSPATELRLDVQYAVSARSLPSRYKFRKWVRAALAGDARITLRILGGREARALNRRHRGRDYATNVLTFAYAGPPRIDGDIAICAAVVTREARALGISGEAHYAHLTVHSVLHLQGYDHQRARAATRMERLETRIMRQLGYAAPYPDRRYRA
jgi:probable rRNA maturation factor